VCHSRFRRLGLCVVLTVNGYSGALLSGLQALPSWNEYFNSPKGNILGLYTASYFLPSIITAFVGDYLAHKHGRRLCIAIGMLVILFGACLNAAAQSVAMWLAGLFPLTVLRFNTDKSQGELSSALASVSPKLALQSSFRRSPILA
jgi:MFS family permease